MKHAGPAALDRLAPLLAALRAQPLVERRPGIFYRRGSAFFHVHEDGTRLWADVKLDGRTFTRLPVGEPAADAALLTAVQQCLA